MVDDESGESMEPMEEVPLIQLSKAELECVVDGGEPGVDSRDEGKHTGRNDLSPQWCPSGICWIMIL